MSDIDAQLAVIEHRLDTLTAEGRERLEDGRRRDMVLADIQRDVGALVAQHAARAPYEAELHALPARVAGLEGRIADAPMPKWLDALIGKDGGWLRSYSFLVLAGFVAVALGAVTVERATAYLKAVANPTTLVPVAQPPAAP
jgi:hypothetical protein